MVVSHYIEMLDMIDKKRKKIYSILSNKLFLTKSDKSILRKYDDLYFEYLLKLENSLKYKVGDESD